MLAEADRAEFRRRLGTAELRTVALVCAGADEDAGKDASQGAGAFVEAGTSRAVAVDTQRTMPQAFLDLHLLL